MWGFWGFGFGCWGYREQVFVIGGGVMHLGVWGDGGGLLVLGSSFLFGGWGFFGTVAVGSHV